MTISHRKPDELRGKSPGANDFGGQFGHPTLIRVPQQRRDEAIQRLVGVGSQMDSQYARRFMEYAGQHRINLEALWARLEPCGRIEFSVLAIANPGRTAMVFASRPLSR